MIAFGGDVLLALRSAGDLDQYTHVAGCRVYGSLDGEILTDAKKAADPSWDAVDDDAWLEQLHKGQNPSPVQDFTYSFIKELIWVPMVTQLFAAGLDKGR